MSNNLILISRVYRAFADVNKPTIVHNLSSSETVAGEYLEIQNDLGCLSRDELSYPQCSMTICDSFLISDEAFCYYLPALAKAVLQKSGLHELLCSRIEKIDRSFLNPEQKAAIDDLIYTLKKIEENFEIEEQQELEQAWQNWERDRAQSEASIDKLLLAIARGSIEEVKQLIDGGANLNEKDDRGNSPLDIAKYRGQTKILELLERAGARETILNGSDLERIFPNPYEQAIDSDEMFRRIDEATEGKQVRVIGRYTQVDVSHPRVQQKQQQPVYMGHVAITLAEESEIFLHPTWHPNAIRPAAEIARYNNQMVVVVGKLVPQSPQSPDMRSHPIPPCFLSIDSIDFWKPEISDDL